MEIKKCTKCHLEKPLTEYYDTSRNSGRKRGSCKECERAANRKQIRKKVERNKNEIFKIKNK